MVLLISSEPGTFFLAIYWNRQYHSNNLYPKTSFSFYY